MHSILRSFANLLCLNLPNFANLEAIFCNVLHIFRMKSRPPRIRIVKSRPNKKPLKSNYEEKIWCWDISAQSSLTTAHKDASRLSFMAMTKRMPEHFPSSLSLTVPPYRSIHRQTSMISIANKMMFDWGWFDFDALAKVACLSKQQKTRWEKRIRNAKSSAKSFFLWLYKKHKKEDGTTIDIFDLTWPRFSLFLKQDSIWI